MKHLTLVFALIALAFSGAKAQLPSFGEIPVEINAENQRFEGGVAVAEGNVEIIYGMTTIYADYAQYNPDTRDVLLIGNVRLYREGHTILAERALYNMETKKLQASDVRGEAYPFQFAADSLTSLTSNAFQAEDAIFTTSDAAKPDYYLRAKRVRIYSKDRIVLSNVTLYVGKLPVAWYPYIYQSLNKQQSFTYTPGMHSSWGAFLLTQVTFPISENMTGQVRLDIRSKRGVALGFNLDFHGGEDKKNWGDFRTYYLHDLDPGFNSTAFQRVPVGPERYRVSLREKFYVTDDIYASVDINKLSDPLVLQDFFESEYQINPQPDNVVALTKVSEDFTLTLTARKQLNRFQDTTERLPELAFEMKRTPVFGSPVYYEGETSVGLLRRDFPHNSGLPDYNAARFDTFHQFTLPLNLFDWLNLTPRIGGRLTYYTHTGDLGLNDATTQRNISILDLESFGTVPNLTGTIGKLASGGSTLRPVFETGLETSFKLSRVYDHVQSRMLGLDGLRHVVQPYSDFSYVLSGKSPDNILQFDRLNPSTQLPPLDMPEFNAVDSISNWTIWRFGVRNRLETRRDNTTFTWLELDTFMDWNIYAPQFRRTLFDEGSVSNLVNKLRFYPLPWMNFQIDAQFPVANRGFTEVNSNVSFLANENLRFLIANRYISGNPFFENSNLIIFGTYYRINDNWAISAREQYEMEDHTLELQRYEIHRDLSSWIATLGFFTRNNHTNSSLATRNGSNEYGLVLTFTLKDFPQLSIPINTPTTGGGGVKGQ